MNYFFVRLINLLKKIFRAEKLFGVKNDIFYINGTESLPPPLTEEEEAAVISRLDSEPELRSLLIEKNLRLVVYISKKFLNTGIGLEDLISIGTIGLIKAINTFKSDKNIKLATYASRCIENEILMYIRKNSSRHTEVSIDEPLNTDYDGNELLLSDLICSDEESVFFDIEMEEDKKTIMSALAKLDEREQKIIELRFGFKSGRELTQKEVADMLGISQSYISRLEKKIISQLKDDISTFI